MTIIIIPSEKTCTYITLFTEGLPVYPVQNIFLNRTFQNGRKSGKNRGDPEVSV